VPGFSSFYLAINAFLPQLSWPAASNGTIFSLGKHGEILPYHPDGGLCKPIYLLKVPTL
jgi:hypothetical protein